MVQMRLPEYDHVVEAFATNRSDEPLNVTVLPRLARRIFIKNCDSHFGSRFSLTRNDRNNPG
jgi:hypothetical protein